MRTLALRSASWASSFEARSLAEITTLYSRLSPWLSVSVTCIFDPPPVFASLTMRRVASKRCSISIKTDAKRPRLPRTRPRAVGAGGGTRTPTILGHRNLNPARLPVPPRPRTQAARPIHCGNDGVSHWARSISAWEAARQRKNDRFVTLDRIVGLQKPGCKGRLRL